MMERSQSTDLPSYRIRRATESNLDAKMDLENPAY